MERSLLGNRSVLIHPVSQQYGNGDIHPLHGNNLHAINSYGRYGNRNIDRLCGYVQVRHSLFLQGHANHRIDSCQCERMRWVGNDDLYGSHAVRELHCDSHIHSKTPHPVKH
jgi:hypothetical protein